MRLGGHPKAASVVPTTLERRPTKTKSSNVSICEPYREAIELALSLGRNATSIWQDLVTVYGFEGSYDSVKRFVRKFRAQPSKAASHDHNGSGRRGAAYGLYETGNAAAMYLAGIVGDVSLMTKKLLDTWAKQASWQMVSEYTVPGVAGESKHARDLAMKWIGSKQEPVASTGWNTYSANIAVTPDDDLAPDQLSHGYGQPPPFAQAAYRAPCASHAAGKSNTVP